MEITRKLIFKERDQICYTKKIENGSAFRMHVNISRLMSAKNTDMLEIVFDLLNVPRELPLKERICYYYLLVPENIS